MRIALAVSLVVASAGLSRCAAPARQQEVTFPTARAGIGNPDLTATVDRLVRDVALESALLAVHVESLADGRVLYSSNPRSRVIPASALKIVTAAVAAEHLGWDHRFETRLDATGVVSDGVLHGDLVVVGSGDPTITARDLRSAPPFEHWAGVLKQAGIQRIEGRLLGDDTAFDDEPLGAGWAWDYLAAGYAAPSGALNYNDNIVVVGVTPAAPGDTTSGGRPAFVRLRPAGHGLDVINRVATGPVGSDASLAIERMPGAGTVTIRGQVPEGGDEVVRATSVENPTTFFVDALRLTLATHGITVRGGAMDIDNHPVSDGEGRRTLARHLSPPLSSIIAHMMKTSSNLYGETLIKALGRAAGADGVGSTERGRRVVRQTLETWGIPADSLVMYDGSGLSRYNYVSVELLVRVLARMWGDGRHRPPFAAALPVAGHDGTLGARMTDRLRRRVQAKTGTINNVRSLAGYAETDAGEKLVFAIIANHFTAPVAAVDAVMERVLEQLLSAGPE